MNDAAAPSSARMMKWYALGVLIASLLAGLIGLMILSRSTRASGQGDDAAFVRAVDLTPLDRAAVLSSGRVKSYDSFASEMLGLVAGRNRVRNQPADFTYLDMMFRPERYRDEPIIYVKNPVIRSQIAAALSESAALGDEEELVFVAIGGVEVDLRREVGAVHEDGLEALRGDGAARRRESRDDRRRAPCPRELTSPSASASAITPA